VSESCVVTASSRMYGGRWPLEIQEPFGDGMYRSKFMSSLTGINIGPFKPIECLGGPSRR